MIAPNPNYFGGDPEKDRPAQPGGAFVLGKENPQMIAVPAESFSRFAEALERIAEIVERLGPKEEAKEEPIQRTLTPQEASKILRLNVQTVMDWCRTGKLKGIKIGGNEINGRGGKWLIPRDEIDAYLRRDRLIKGPRKEAGK
jgi:excisionase family DNA binding protein